MLMNSRFRLVFIVSILIVLLGMVASYAYHKQERVNQPTFVSQEGLHTQWKTQVTTILSVFDQDQNAAKAKQDLLNLHVAKIDQDLHLNLVLAMEAIYSKASDGMEKLTQARTEFEKQVDQ